MCVCGGGGEAGLVSWIKSSGGSSDLGFMARSWAGRESRGKRKLRHRGYLAISLIACSGCKGPG